ncbi:MAG: hypothetical protein F6J92_35065 [Symploca sp. SIO1A3]|nr:hypothetical protein [Symploca sp. SIO1A3]
MPTVADYIVIRKGTFILQAGADIDKDFSFVLSSEPKDDAVLVFIIDIPRSANQSSISLRVIINDEAVLDRIFPSGLQGTTYHSVIDGSKLRQGENEISFELDPNRSERVGLADVVLWWH